MIEKCKNEKAEAEAIVAWVQMLKKSVVSEPTRSA